MFFQSLPYLALGLVLASCTSMRSPIVPGAKPKDHGAIGATEGPAWKDGSLYFTDGKHINCLGPDGKTTVFRHNASNGLAFDKEGRLIACESGLRRVTRTEKDGSITVMADRFEGKRFNTPNDLCIDSKGRIYFTDPRYGSREGMEIHDKTLNPSRGMFFTGNGSPENVAKSLRENPICLKFDKTSGKTYASHRGFQSLKHLSSPTIFPPSSGKTHVRQFPVLLGALQNEHEDHVLLPSCLIEAVYRIDGPGKVTQVLEGGSVPIYPATQNTHNVSASKTPTSLFRLERPNGILISPDGRYLYVADNNNNTHGGSRKIWRYELDKRGDLKMYGGGPKVIFDWKNGRGPDGMKMDSAGRIYVAAGTNKATEFETTEFKAGCYILSPSGRLIDFIPTAPDEACNCTFGGKDGKTLFITSGGHLWSVPLR